MLHAAVFILMLENVTSSLLEALRIARTQQRVQHNVVGFESSVGFQFAAPVSLFILLGKQELARAINRSGYAAGKIIYFSEA